MASNVKTFVVWDYVVFCLVLVISALIGIYYGCTGGKQKTTREFLMADRNMQILPVALSMLASFMSAIMTLGTPAEIYIYGTQYMVIAFAHLLVAPVAAFVYMPVFYRLKLTSAYEYLEVRFKNKVLRAAGSCIYIFQMIMYMAIVLYAPSLALNAVTGLNLWGAVFSVGCVCTFYTTLGGMKAVMWTDVIQIVFMVAGLLAVLIQGIIDQDGFSNILQAAREGQRLEFFDFDPDPSSRHTVWTLVVGGFFMWLAINGTNQSIVQRALTCPSLKSAQIALLLNCPGLIVLLILTSFCGLAMYAHFQTCDPLTNKDVMASDQLLPLYVMEALGHAPGVPGLFVACLFSGTLSTVSSGLNSLAAVTIEDIVRSVIKPDITEERATLLSKLLAFVFGIVMMVLSVVAAQLGSVLQAALALFGIIGGPLLGIFTLGMFFPCANWKGGLSGLLGALVIQLWIGVGAVVVKPARPRPPLYVHGCPSDNVTDSVLVGNLTYGTNLTDFTNTVLQNLTLTTTEALPEVITKDSSFLARIYSLSYLWYTALAVFDVLVLGLIVSFLTGPTKSSEVDPRTICPLFNVLCPCLPKSWRKYLECGVLHEEEDTLDKQTVKTHPSEPLMERNADGSKTNRSNTGETNTNTKNGTCV